ncbi:MAG TPA: riboflavin synthase [Candidatus Aquicultor sp.]|jgi:riboflavin synthase
MFTGIIEELGTIKSIKRGTDDFIIEIAAPKLTPEVTLGDSIAVNGICLTAASKTSGAFTVDVMPETLAKSDLDEIKPGEAVNLERALTLSSRLGGHMVAGHVDGVGTIRSKTVQKNALIIKMSAPEAVTRYLVDRGSVAADGISLTVIDYGQGHITVSIIPHTAKMTTLGFKKSGDKVNLEADMIGKYVAKFVAQHQGPRPGITMDALRENGFE